MTNPPAFPRPAGFNGLDNPQEHECNDPQEGMTLRDYVAAQALAAGLAGSMEWVSATHQDSINRAVSLAFDVADAWMAEREKRLAQ